MNLQEKNESIQHEVKDEVKELKECMKKIEGELALSKNISELLSDRLVNMERQCWANTSKEYQQVTWKKRFLKCWRKLVWKFQQSTLMYAIGLANKDESL